MPQEQSKGQAVEAPTQSTPEDAILSLLGDEDEPAEGGPVDDSAGDGQAGDGPADGESAEGETEEPRYKVKIDGKEEEVPLSELVSGYQRQADYTRKTQKLAEERKRVMEEAQLAAGERQRYAAALAALERQLVGDEPNWEALRQADPARFAEEFTSYQRRMKAVQAIRQELDTLQEIAAQQQQAELERRLEQERELMLSAIPEWVDPARRESERKALVSYAKSLGFTEEDVDSIYDHRVVSLLRKAWLYDQASAKKGEVVAKRTPAVKTAPPGGAKVNVSALKRASERLKKTGSIEDAANVFEAFL